jgi:DNA-binding FadR family transcriptional regulator
LAQKPGRAEVSINEHLAIIEAICRRDARGAESAMAAHLDSVITAMREVHNREKTTR